MLTKIQVDDLEVYTNEIIHPDEFKKLYQKEKILVNFNAQVNAVYSRAFATFIAEKRYKFNVKEGEVSIFRISKGKKKFEFISQIGKWGRFHIFKEVIEVLEIKNHDLLKLEIVEITRNKSFNSYIDLSKLKYSSILFRENNFITIYQKGKVPITLPRFVEITPDLIELFYLIHGDGHYNSKLFFVNKDNGLHEFVLRKFEDLLRIPRNVWRARFLYNNKEDPGLAIKRWKKNLKLEDNQFYPSISKCILNTSKDGLLRIVIDKRIVAEIFRYIFSSIKNQTSGKNAIYALNGLLCAEGSAEQAKNLSLHKITLSFSQKEKEMFKSILIEAGIYSFIKDRNDRFVIEGWKNIFRFFNIFFNNDIVPFSIHRLRREKVINGFLEHSFTKNLINYLVTINSKKLTTDELINALGNSSDSVLRTLKTDKYKDFFQIIGNGINKNTFNISITKEGEDFINLINKIRNSKIHGN